ncbi:MAG: HlyD family secretion protein [Nitrospirae bacterium]|nr:HlyD family secretion protein [Nitrospirota bacterium]
MKARIKIIPLVIVLLAAAALYLYSREEKKEPALISTGIIEGTEVNISAKVSGRILELFCTEGDSVKEGQTIIRLESDDLAALVEQAKAGIERSRAEIKVAESSLWSAEADVRSAEADIKNAEADVEKTRALTDEAKRELDRAESLFKEEYITKASLDLARTNHDTSTANHTSSKARLKAAHSKKDAASARLNTAVSELDSAKAKMKESGANLFYNTSRLKDTMISSPISGTVVFKSLEKGEMASPGTTIMTIVDMNNLYARVDIEETKVGLVSLGKDAIIRTEGIKGREFKGKVSEIGRYADFATQRDVVRGRQDIKTFRVKIKVQNPDGLLKPGMTVEVKIPYGDG